MAAELSSCPGGRVLPLKVDISDHAAIEDAVAKVNEELGAPSILVNVAGILSNNKLAETSAEEWDRVMNINVTAAFLLCKACCPAMAAQGWGRVVNISSWAWKSGGLTAVRARTLSRCREERRRTPQMHCVIMYIDVRCNRMLH